MSPRAGVAILAALVLLAGSLQLTRAGYSPDEEFTVFAVKGIAADGLPLLPSGLLYDRGVAYSYAGALARAATGFELPAYRALSLVAAVAAIALVFALVSRLSSPAIGLVASLLVATSTPFWAAATTGRFYAPFFALYLSTLWALSTLGTKPLGTPGTVRTLGTIALVAAVCRWTHELAFTLAAVPVACAVLDVRSERAHWLKATAAVVGGLVFAQVGLFAMHYLAPFSGQMMIDRFFIWQVVNLFEAPPDRQFGIVLAVMAIAWLVAPRRAWFTTVIGLSGASMVLAFAIARATNTAPLSRALMVSILDDGSRYPLDMFWHIARATPVTLAAAVGLLVTRRAGVGGAWRAPERAAHLLWIGWVLWFGVIESGITTNYLLLPMSFMLIAIAIDVAAIVKGPGPSTPPRVALFALLVIAAVVADQWRGTGSIADRLAAARPTIVAPGIDEIRDSLQPADRIACTDELGCLMLVGRIDAWLALDDYVRERFLVKMGDEQVAGVYTGAPAVFRPGELFSPRRAGTLPDRTLVVDIFKEYPVGNSRAWLPRAIEVDGLEVRPLLETPQLRILQISPPESHASRQRWTGGDKPLRPRRRALSPCYHPALVADARDRNGSIWPCQVASGPFRSTP